MLGVRRVIVVGIILKRKKLGVVQEGGWDSCMSWSFASF